ncbi:hypothetical protein AAF712_007925 [Marasmius tenuissimus]|uniref:Uncharacterized protein n=1 Tax=Marasmius tenuissimus TaxID=585030 RepID=A0ABR2ZVA4_9AGAR
MAAFAYSQTHANVSESPGPLPYESMKHAPLTSEYLTLIGLADRCCPGGYLLCATIEKEYDHVGFKIPEGHLNWSPWWAPLWLPEHLLEKMESILIKLVHEFFESKPSADGSGGSPVLPVKADLDIKLAGINLDHEPYHPDAGASTLTSEREFDGAQW